MKASYKIITIVSLLSGLALGAQAQALRTGYFSESYIFRHQMNPALANDDGYVSIPILGAFGVGVGTNIGVKDIIYKQNDGSLTTFMNSSVSSKEFHDNVTKNALLNFDLNTTLLSVGFKAGKSYNTIEVGLHTRAGVTVDKDLFYFMKDMSSNVTYDFSDTKATGMAWADVSYGYSRNITDDLRIGAKIKALLGIGYASADLDGSYAKFGSNQWLVNNNGKLNIAGGGTMTTKNNSTEMDGYDDFTPGLNGFGMAFDLGAVYSFEKLVPGLSVSASITDLGWLKWDCAKASADNELFEFDGFNNLKMHDNQGTVINGQNGYTDGSLDEQWERIEDDLEDMSHFNVVSQSEKINESIGATATVGVEYKLPVYRKISFGALYTQRISDVFKYNEGRLVFNYAPSRIFDLALSGTATNYGTGIGGLLNLHVPGFNLYVGIDHFYMGETNSDMIPLEKCSEAFTLGMNITFGRPKNK